MKTRPERVAAVAVLVAVVDAKPGIRKSELQAELGLSDFAFGRAFATARIQALVTVDAGRVELTEKARSLLDADEIAS